jgi:polyhydroxybutyrate depolymerase
MRFISASLVSAVFLLAACGDDSSSGGSGGTGGETTGGQGGGTGGEVASGGSGGSGGGATGTTVGGNRPVEVIVPSSYDEAVATPLLILLHGYSADGPVQDLYFGFTEMAEERGFLYAYPSGTLDQTGENFWNATPACCNFGDEPVDDSAYLIGLVDEISAKWNVDPKRVYFVGHSNGGFMSHRMACDHADKVAAIVSLAGANFLDPADCTASEPVSVVQIHGTADDTIAYEGGSTLGGAATTYPSAAESVAAWAVVDGCVGEPAAAGTKDLTAQTTNVLKYSGCTAGTDVELWTIEGGGHIPVFTDGFGPAVFDFLEAHPKP